LPARKGRRECRVNIPRGRCPSNLRGGGDRCKKIPRKPRKNRSLTILKASRGKEGEVQNSAKKIQGRKGKGENSLDGGKITQTPKKGKGARKTERKPVKGGPPLKEGTRTPLNILGGKNSEKIFKKNPP